MLDNAALAFDGGAFITPKFAGAGTLTAAGAGDATAINGPWIDRAPQNAAGVSAMSCLVSSAWQAVLAATKTLAIAITLQDADDTSGTNPATYGTIVASTVVGTGAGGGSTEKGVLSAKFNLAGARRAIRAVVTPDLNASGTDTAIVATIIDLLGLERLPGTL